MSVYLIIDNGSKKAEATIRLRKLTQDLSKAASKTVYAVSLQHSDAIDKDKLNNIPANTFYSFLNQQLKKGERDFIALPLFFGASRALSSFIPEQVVLLEKEFGYFSIKVADVIFPLPQGESRLSEILCDHIRQTAGDTTLHSKNIVLVDHGSPIPQITEVRKQVATQIRSMLGDNVIVDEAVMEKRAGRSYEFNGALLEDYLNQQAKKGNNDIIVAMLFFLPGRHAGECGDIQEICERVKAQYPLLQISITPLISEHDLLISILHDRLLSVD